MSSKTIVMLGMIIGSTIGGYVPLIFGISLFSFTSAIFSALGGLIGIYITYKMTAR